MKTVKCVQLIGFVATVVAAGTVEHASAANRTWTATASGASLTAGGSGGSWNNAAVPGSSDTGLFNQGGSGTGSGATTSPSVTGTSFNPAVLTFGNASGHDVAIGGTGTITIGKANQTSANAWIRTSSSGGVTFSNSEIDFNAGNSGIFTSGIAGGNVTMNTTAFKMGLGSATGSKNFLVAGDTNVVQITPAVDFSAISADQPLTLVSHAGGAVNLVNGITGSASFVTNVAINNDTSDDPDQISTVTIGGTSTFTGTTTIGGGDANHAGTAIFSGAYHGSGTTTVNSFATVAGEGNISGAIDLLGIMSAGNSPAVAGTLTTGSLTLEAGSSGIFDLQNTAGNHAGSGNDLIAITSGLTLTGGGFAINVSPVGGGLLNNAGTWELMSYTGTSGSLGPVTLMGVDTTDYNAVVTVGAGFNGAGVYLTLTPVPEPGTLVLANLGLIGIVAMRRVCRK